MHKDSATRSDCLPDETVSTCEMLAKVFPRNIHNMDNFVLEITRKTGVESCEDLKDMRYTLAMFKALLILTCYFSKNKLPAARMSPR